MISFPQIDEHSPPTATNIKAQGGAAFGKTLGKRGEPFSLAVGEQHVGPTATKIDWNV